MDVLIPSLSHRTSAALALAVLAAGCAAVSELGSARASTLRPCVAPHLAGSTLGAARSRARRAGCALRLYEAAAVDTLPARPRLRADQIVVRQSPRAGRLTDTVTMFVKPLCAQSAEPGPPAGEPFVRRGPTELVSGLFLDGGPLAFSPRCRAGVPSPGTLRVLDAASGRAIASRTVAAGRLAIFALAPGRYEVSGTFSNAQGDGMPIQARPVSVTIEAGKTTRRDVAAAIP